MKTFENRWRRDGCHVEMDSMTAVVVGVLKLECTMNFNSNEIDAVAVEGALPCPSLLTKACARLPASLHSLIH